MTTLWREVQLSPDGPMDQVLLTNLNGYMKCIPKYIRTIHLTVIKYHGFHESYLEMIPQFATNLLQLMEEAIRLHSVVLDFHLFHPEDYEPEYEQLVNDTNGILMNLLRYIAQRSLPDLELIIWFNPDIENVIDVIQPKVTKLVARDWGLTGHWVHKLPSFENLKYIEIQDAQNAETSACCKIWTAISDLQISIVEETSVPYPLTLDLQFPHLVHVCLEVSPPEGNWERTFVTVFSRMPNLRTAELTSRMFYWFEQIANAVRIDEVACTHLRELTIHPYCPKTLLSAVARSCPHLFACDFGGNHLDDKDLFVLSQCPRLRRLRIRFAGDITRGFRFLSNISSLTHLTIPAAFGCYLDEQILFRFASNCPALHTIVVLARQRRYRDRTVPPEAIFPAAATMRHIFEPDVHKHRWHAMERDSYKIHVYQLRQEILDSTAA